MGFLRWLKLCATSFGTVYLAILLFVTLWIIIAKLVQWHGRSNDQEDGQND